MNEHDKNLGICWDVDKVGKALKEPNEPEIENIEPFFNVEDFKETIRTITEPL